MSLIETFQQPNNVLVRALRELLDAPSKEEAKATLERNKALLITDAAINLLHDFHREVMLQPVAENMYDPSYILYHKWLLEEASRHGIPQGWDAADAMISRFHKSREEMKHYMRDVLKDME